MPFTDDILARADGLQQAILNHPFVTGIGDGTLDMERFKHFIRQDYLYLIEFGRVLALASAKAPSLEAMGRFADLLNETLNTEMSLHRGYCARFGITEAELEATQPAPTMQAYTDFLVRTAYDGSFGELACALLPCMWGYCEIGLTLAERGKPTGQPPVRRVDRHVFGAGVQGPGRLVAGPGGPLSGKRQSGGTAADGGGVRYQHALRVRFLGHGLPTGGMAGVDRAGRAPTFFLTGC